GPKTVQLGPRHRRHRADDVRSPQPADRPGVGRRPRMPRQTGVRISDPAQRSLVGGTQPRFAGIDIRPFMRREPRLHGVGARADRSPVAGKESRMSADDRTDSRVPPRRLGRGLGALLGEARREEPLITHGREYTAEEAAAFAPARPGDGLANLPVASIEPHPDQPRRVFDEAALDELAASIAARGVIQPVIVRPIAPGRWQLVAGERRWRAAQKAQLHEIPALIRELEDLEVMALAL